MTDAATFTDADVERDAQATELATLEHEIAAAEEAGDNMDTKAAQKRQARVDELRGILTP